MYELPSDHLSSINDNAFAIQFVLFEHAEECPLWLIFVIGCRLLDIDGIKTFHLTMGLYPVGLYLIVDVGVWPLYFVGFPFGYTII